MNLISRSLSRRVTRAALTVLCITAIGRGNAFAAIRLPVQAVPQTSSADTRIPPEQLDSLVAPIALYPDPLLAQTLAASTYPLELMQLQQWLTKHRGLSGKALADAVAREPWDPSVQAMAALPDVVTRLTQDIQWTTDLGNAFLAQESDVMSAVQRMRQKAEGTGSLTSTPQQVVETRVIDNKEVIVIEQANPQVVYVPSYNPVAVYGPPVYPYPSIYYPSHYSSGWYPGAAALSFGAGVAMGAFWGNGGWGWNTGWGRGDIDINRNANFVRNSNFYRNGNFNNWQHNAAHRRGTAYGNRTTAARYGGVARGDALSNRASTARQQINRQGGNLASRPNAGAYRGNAGAYRGNAGGNRGNVAGTRGQYSGNRGAVGTTGRTGQQFRSGSRGQYGGSNLGQYRGGSGNRNFSGGYSGNRGSFSGGNRGSFSGGNRGGSRGSFGGGSRGGFGGGGRRGGGGGGGRRGGGGGRR